MAGCQDLFRYRKLKAPFFWQGLNHILSNLTWHVRTRRIGLLVGGGCPEELIVCKHTPRPETRSIMPKCTLCHAIHTSAHSRWAQNLISHMNLRSPVLLEAPVLLSPENSGIGCTLEESISAARSRLSDAIFHARQMNALHHFSHSV